MSTDDSGMRVSHRIKKLENMNKKNKAPSVSGYDKRNPLQKSLLKLTTKNLSPISLSDINKMNPFFMEELGGNMLNINHIFQMNQLTHPESNENIEKFLVESRQVYTSICICTYV